MFCWESDSSSMTWASEAFLSFEIRSVSSIKYLFRFYNLWDSICEKSWLAETWLLLFLAYFFFSVMSFIRDISYYYLLLFVLVCESIVLLFLLVKTHLVVLLFSLLFTFLLEELFFKGVEYMSRSERCLASIGDAFWMLFILLFVAITLDLFDTARSLLLDNAYFGFLEDFLFIFNFLFL